MTLRPVDSTTARVALHRSARSRGYKLSREEMDLRSLWWSVCLVEYVCGLSEVSPLRPVSASPFIVPKGRARVTVVVKR
jgi:hypothetical protein